MTDRPRRLRNRHEARWPITTTFTPDAPMHMSKEIIEDCSGYGDVLVAWEGVREVHRGPAAMLPFGPLSLEDARKFINAVYALVRTKQPITIYRFYETAGLKVPFGENHPSYLSGRTATRNPAGKWGGWWSPRRPALMIDNLGYPAAHRRDDRHYIAVRKEWNRFDTCLEATLQPGSLVYAGRTAPQAEDRAFETDEGATILYSGGAMQFLLVRQASDVTPEQEYQVR